MAGPASALGDAPEWIVGEASKNWPNDDRTTVSRLFEHIVNVNWRRGYALHTMTLSTVVLPDGMIETIIGVFRRSNKSIPFQPGRTFWRDRWGSEWAEDLDSNS